MNQRPYVPWLACRRAWPLAAAGAPRKACARRPSRALAGRPPRAADSGPRPADYIVAVVNSEPITNNEVRSRMVRFEQQLAQQGQAGAAARRSSRARCWSG